MDRVGLGPVLSLIAVADSSPARHELSPIPIRPCCSGAEGNGGVGMESRLKGAEMGPELPPGFLFCCSSVSAGECRIHRTWEHGFPYGKELDHGWI